MASTFRRTELLRYVDDLWKKLHEMSTGVPPIAQDERLVRAAVVDALAGLLAAQATVSSLGNTIRMVDASRRLQ